jgi:hypothetical protein
MLAGCGNGKKVVSLPKSDSASQYVGTWTDIDPCVGGGAAATFTVTESNGILSISAPGYVYSLPDTSNGTLKITQTF